jgi:uncharacterized protein YciI
MGVPSTFDRLTVVHLVRPPHPPEVSDADAERIQGEHLDYLRSLAERGVMPAHGPCREQDDPRLRGICLFTVPPDEVRRLMAADPWVRMGRLAVEIVEWWTPAGTLPFRLSEPGRLE